MSGDAPSDHELDDVFASGRDDALRLAYERYGSLVHTVCRRVLDPTSAADVTQEVFVASWRAHRRYEPSRGSLGAWLLTITRHKIIDHLRSSARRPPTSAREAPAEPGPVDNAHSAELDAIIDRLLLTDALNQLSPRARSVVELAFWSDLTQAQIAERRGLPLGTVKSDLRRSLLQLSRHLRAHGLDGTESGCGP